MSSLEAVCPGVKQAATDTGLIVVSLGCFLRANAYQAEKLNDLNDIDCFSKRQKNVIIRDQRF